MQKTKGKRLAFEMLFALVLFLLLIAILVTELSRASDAYFYEQAESSTYVQTDILTGYLFRNEVAPGTLNNGPINYLAENGTKSITLAHLSRENNTPDRAYEITRSALDFGGYPNVELNVASPVISICVHK